MKTSTAVVLALGSAAVAGIAMVSLSAKASPRKLPAPGKPPRLPRAPKGDANGNGDAAADPKASGGDPDVVGGHKVRRPVAPNPREAQWADLEESVALLSTDAQWRFAVPEDRAGAFADGVQVLMRVDTPDGLAAAETTASATGFNLISRVGPSVSLNRDAGVLQIYTGGYTGRVLLEAGDVMLTAWVLSPEAKITAGTTPGMVHIIDQRVDGVWQVYAFSVDEAGMANGSESGEFLEEAAALAWADAWLEQERKVA